MSADIGAHSAVCPLMAAETDAGMEAPAKGLTPESGRRIDGVFGSSLSCPTFFFSGVGALNFRVEGALVNHASPGWSVRCCVFPWGDVDVKVLEVSFQGVSEVLAFSFYLPCPLTKLTIQQLLGYCGIWHSEDMTCPAYLCIAVDDFASMLAERESVLPRYGKLTTAWSLCPFTVMLGAWYGFPGASWYITSVFFVLMGRPKLSQAVENPSISSCITCSLLAFSAQSSAKRRSLITVSLTLVTACRRRGLNSFP